jgi:hypothetical protein
VSAQSSYVRFPPNSDLRPPNAMSASRRFATFGRS